MDNFEKPSHPCVLCGGSGKILIDSFKICPTCKGEKTGCPVCHGEGRVPFHKRVMCPCCGGSRKTYV